MSRIRPAEPEDLPAMHAMATLAFQEAETYNHLTYEPLTAEHMIRTDPSVCSFVSEGDEGDLNGMIIGQLQRGLFFKETIVTNLLFYVLPNKRGTNISFRLARRLERFAREAGCAQVHLTTSGGFNSKRLMKFFNGLGYTEAGVATIKDL